MSQVRRVPLARVCVAILILVPVAMAGWWYWPSGDPRFVGKWDIGFGTIIHRSNGVLEQYDSNGELLSKRRWAVVGDKYYDGFPTADPKKILRAIEFDNWMFRNWHLSMAPKQSDFTYKFITPDEFVLTFLPTNEPRTWKRIK